MTTALSARDLAIGYDAHRLIGKALDLEVPRGAFVTVIGPNACGKSTLLRTLARLLPPRAGSVLIDGRSAATLRPKEFARSVGLLPQSPTAPAGLTVRQLVDRGRYPHRGPFSSWSAADAAAVATALDATGLTALADRRVDDLSGGQRQRVWIALVLAQDTPVILLDEPTTFLDLAHQLEVLELFRHVNESGRTVVAVLHDMAQAARSASHIVAMREGRIVAAGTPADVLTRETVRSVFDVDCHVLEDPETGGPLVVPRLLR